MKISLLLDVKLIVSILRGDKHFFKVIWGPLCSLMYAIIAANNGIHCLVTESYFAPLICARKKVIFDVLNSANLCRRIVHSARCILVVVEYVYYPTN